MKSDQIENLLRKPPRVAIPTGLRERLQSDIKLPTADRAAVRRDYAPSFLKRWLPALSVALWLLACLVMLALQSRTLSSLRQERDALRAAATERQQVVSPSVESELIQLRADAEEVRKLRAEVARATAQLDELKPLRAENQRLTEQLKGSHGSAPPQPDQDFFAKADSIKCINNLKQVGLGARLWANDHNDLLPTSFDQMYPNQLPNKSVFFCPAGDGTVQYELVSPGAPESDPEVVYARCPRHNKVVLCDGSVQSPRTLKLVVRPDGATVMGQ